MNAPSNTDLRPVVPVNEDQPRRESARKFRIRNVPNEFSECQNFVESLQLIEEDMKVMEVNQSRIDEKYDEITQVYLTQMEQFFVPINNICGTKPHRKAKPWWNDELKTLWKKARNSEKILYKAKKDNTRSWEIQELRENFKENRANFDRVFQKEKRKYYRQWQIKLEKLDVNNPKVFWDEINKLKPKIKSEIPMEVYDDQGNVTNDLVYVVNKWKAEFEKLYCVCENEEGNYDLLFLQVLKEGLRVKEIDLELHSIDKHFNRRITIDEVKKVIVKSKNGKAVNGEIDPLPNEIFKNDASAVILHTLFDICFEVGIRPKKLNMATINPIPKNRLNDRRIPLNFRGISLLSCVGKMCSSVLTLEHCIR